MQVNRLRFGDTIAVIAPASCEENYVIDEKIALLEDLGFNTKRGSHLYDKYGYLAGQDKDRAKDLMDAFLDEEVTMIICFRGGYGTMRMLPYLDFEIIKANPKIFMGYSDITTLLNTIYSKCHMITFHGPMVNSDLTDKYTLKSFVNTLMLGLKPYEIKNPKGIALEFKGNNNISGTLAGGNLSLITSTLQTPYEIDTKDKILFIEEISEEPYAIDRMLSQLALSNKLNQCKGFILGQFKDCSSTDKNTLELKEIIDHYILSLNKPTVMNLMCGHDQPNITLPIGAKIEINIKDKSLNVLEPVIY